MKAWGLRGRREGKSACSRRRVAPSSVPYSCMRVSTYSIESIDSNSKPDIFCSLLVCTFVNVSCQYSSCSVLHMYLYRLVPHQLMQHDLRLDLPRQQSSILFPSAATPTTLTRCRPSEPLTNACTGDSLDTARWGLHGNTRSQREDEDEKKHVQII